MTNAYIDQLPLSEPHLVTYTGRLSVLFLCVHNAGRSQMAAGWLRHIAGDRIDVYLAGSEPASEIKTSPLSVRYATRSASVSINSSANPAGNQILDGRSFAAFVVGTNGRYADRSKPEPTTFAALAFDELASMI